MCALLPEMVNARILNRCCPSATPKTISTESPGRPIALSRKQPGGYATTYRPRMGAQTQRREPLTGEPRLARGVRTLDQCRSFCRAHFKTTFPTQGWPMGTVVGPPLRIARMALLSGPVLLNGVAVAGTLLHTHVFRAGRIDGRIAAASAPQLCSHWFRPPAQRHRSSYESA